MLYRNHTEMRNSLATFDVNRIIATLFMLIVGAALINCNNAPIYAYASILLAPKVLGSSNSIPSDSENGIAKPFSQIHSRQTFLQQSDQLQLPQPNSSTGPSSLSLLSEFPTRMSQLPSELFSSAASSITSQVSPTQQPILQQQQQQPTTTTTTTTNLQQQQQQPLQQQQQPTTTATTTTTTAATATKLSIVVSILTGILLPRYIPAYDRWPRVS